MNKTIKDYLGRVKGLFPIWGRAERRYWKRLAAALEDQFRDRPPSNMEELFRVFAPPQEVVREYLSQTDIHRVVRRIKNRKLVKFGASVVAVVALLSAITLSVQQGMYYAALRRAIEFEFTAVFQEAPAPQWGLDASVQVEL